MPKGKLTYRRGDIRWVKLDPTVGAEAQKTRACLIIQMDTINQHGLLTIVIPFLSGRKKAPQGHFILDLGDEFRWFQPSKTKISDAWNGAFS